MSFLNNVKWVKNIICVNGKGGDCIISWLLFGIGISVWTCKRKSNGVSYETCES